MKYTLKRILALFLLVGILIPARGVFALPMESPRALSLALSPDEAGVSISWENPAWVKEQLAAGKKVAYEIDSKVNLEPWSSKSGHVYKAELTAGEKDRVMKNLTANDFTQLTTIDIRSNQYSFRVRYVAEGGSSAFGNAVSVGYRPVFNNSSAWSLEELSAAGNNGLIPPSVKADMKKEISREEFTEVIVRLYEKVERVHLAASKSPFKDTKNESVVIASRLGLVYGVGNGKFAPNAKITREEMATILARFLKSVNVEGSHAVGNTFADHDKISKYARESVYELQSMGLMSGYENNQFRPKTNASREQGVVLGQRIYEFIKK